MSKIFDYEKIFMGVTADRSQGFQFRVLKEDYRLGRLMEAIPSVEGKMLDIGCGGGTLTECLPYFYPQVKVFGCDASKAGISYAQKYTEGKVKYGLIKNNRWPYRKNHFDACVCFDVLEHIPDLPIFFSELKRVLKKDGLFYLAIPCEGEPFTFTWVLQKIKIGQKLTFKHVGHLHPEFTHEYLSKLLDNYKFSILEKTYGDHLFYQFGIFIGYFLAKELLEFILGPEKAEQYYDRTLLVKNRKNKINRDIFIFLRNVWIKLWGLSYIMIYCERKFLKNVSFGGWKLFVLSRNRK